VLVQLGLLQPGSLPVVRAEGRRSLLDRGIRLVNLIHRTKVTPRKGGRGSPKPSSVISVRRFLWSI
jgi:hypothetical protein